MARQRACSPGRDPHGRDPARPAPYRTPRPRPRPQTVTLRRALPLDIKRAFDVCAWLGRAGQAGRRGGVLLRSRRQQGPRASLPHGLPALSHCASASTPPAPPAALVRRESSLHSVGIEGLTVDFEWERYAGHHRERGWNGIELEKVSRAGWWAGAVWNSVWRGGGAGTRAGVLQEAAARFKRWEELHA